FAIRIAIALAIKHGKCINKSLFAGRQSQAQTPCFLHLRWSALQSACRHWRLPQLVVIAHGHTPPGHGTLGVTLRDLEKLSLRGRVSKRVQQCDRVIERSLHRRRARNREDNLTELFRRRMLVLAKTKRQIKEAVHPRE